MQRSLPLQNLFVGVVYPDTPEWPKMKWVHEALISLGIRVERAQTIEKVRQLDDCCDLLIFMQRSSGIGGPDICRLAQTRKAIWCQWYFDLNAYTAGVPLAENGSLAGRNYGSCTDIARAMDIVFVKEREMLAEYRMLGINAAYLDQGVPVHQPECVRSNVPDWDVLLWGQGGSQYRQRICDIKTLAEAGFRCAWATKDAVCPNYVERLPWCHPDKLHELAGRACCVLSVDLRHDVHSYRSDRFWVALGMGCCVLRRFSPGLPKGPYVVYSDSVDLVNKVTSLLSHKDSSAVWPPGVLAMGREARKWSVQHHSLANRCRQLLAYVQTATVQAG